MGENQGVSVVTTATGGTGFSTSSVPKLDGKNYASWRELIDIILELRGLKKAMTEENVDSKINLQAKLILLETLDESHRAQVRGQERAIDIIKRLELIYCDKSEANVYRLLLQYYRYEKKPEDSVSEHIGRMDSMRNQLADLGEKQSERLYQVTLIGSLPKEYSSIMEIWQLTHDSMRTTPNLVARLLKREEDVKKGATEQAFIAKSAERPRMSIAELKKVTNCAKCGRKGHWARECSKAKEEAAMSVSVNPVVREEVNFNVNTGSTGMKVKWICDSGASSHMCNELEWFAGLKLSNDLGSVKVGDGTPVPIKGIGTVRMQFAVGGKIIEALLHDVIYVPELAVNLFSAGAAAQHGIKTVFDSGKCELVRKADGQVVGIGHEIKERIWVLEAAAAPRPTSQSALSTIGHYHRILGHAGVGRVKALLKELGKEVTDEAGFECPDCAIGKGRRVSHPSREHDVQAPGIVHVDLSGLVNKASIEGYNYYMLAKDHFSEFTFAYFCKNKSEVPTLIARLIVDFEVLSGGKIREIHTDGGSEFVNKVNGLLFLKEKITHRTSAPYCPQQNGRIESEMKTITQAARTVLHASKLPRELWSAAILYAVYCKNRLPTSKSKLTPFERLLNRKPSIDHCCEFGAEVQVIVNGEYLTKWDSRTEPGFAVGYTARRNTYRVYVPRTQRVIESCDVIFVRHSNVQRAQQDEKEKGDDLRTKVLVETTVVDDKHQNCSENNQSSHRDEEFHTAAPLSTSTPMKKSTRTGPQLDEFFRRYCDSEASDYERPYENDEQSTVTQSHSIATRPSISPPAPPVLERRDSRSSSSPLSPPDLERHDSEEIYENFGFFGAISDSETPVSYTDAMSLENRRFWEQPIQKEIEALEQNATWAIVPRPSAKVLSTKWVFTIKRDARGRIEKRKARLVVRGFEQRYGIDFFQTFAPVARLESIRLVFAVATAYNLTMLQFDISTAFLNGKVNEEVFIEAPAGYEIASEQCLKLNKALYGLRQAPRAWNSTFDETISELGFKASLSDLCVYVHKKEQLYLILYVDDGLIFGKSDEACREVLARIKACYSLRQLEGEMFIGIKIERRDGGIKLSQHRYVQDILRRFNMADAKEASSPLLTTDDLLNVAEGDKQADVPYRQALGCLQYLACCTRPDIIFATNFLSQFNNAPKEKHWEAVKRVIRYLKRTIDYGLHFTAGRAEIKLSSFSDADFGKLTKDNGGEVRRSTSGILLLVNNAPVVFCSRRQSTTVAQSSTEAEYVAANEAGKEIKWASQFVHELRLNHSVPKLLIDNQSAITQIENGDTKRRSKHVELKFHWIREEFKKGLFKLEYVESRNQLADFLTKPLDGPNLARLLDKINMNDGRSRCAQTGTLSGLKAMFVLMIYLSLISLCSAARFERLPPQIFLDSPFEPMLGVRNIELDLTLVNPCELDEPVSKESTYGLRSIAFARIRELCLVEFNLVREELKRVASCMPLKVRRPKRVAPLVIGAVALVSAVGGTAAYRYCSPSSDYNRIGALETWANNTGSRLEALEGAMVEVTREAGLAREVRTMILEATKTNLDRHQESKKAIKELTFMTPEIAWQTTRLSQKLSDYREGLEMLRYSCKTRQFSVKGLNKLIVLKEFGEAESVDTYLTEVKQLDDLTISFEVLVNVRRENYMIFEVVGIDHWTNYTIEPSLVEYKGLKLALYNDEKKCLSGLILPKTRQVYESCEIENYRDRSLDIWTPKPAGPDGVLKAPDPLVVQVGADNVIYCLYYDITLEGRVNKCPPWPFRLPRTKTFSFANMSYTVDHSHITKRSFQPKITLEMSPNETDNEYDRDAKYFDIIKLKHDTTVPARQFQISKGTLTIPLDHLQNIGYGTLGIIASVITIWRCIARYAERAQGSTEVHEDTHREEHREQIIINPDVSRILEDHSKRVEAMMQVLVAGVSRRPSVPVQSRVTTESSRGLRPLPPVPTETKVELVT